MVVVYLKYKIIIASNTLMKSVESKWNSEDNYNNCVVLYQETFTG